MTRKAIAQKEENFQGVANKYARNSIECMREELDNTKEEDSRERIMSEGALSVEVRSDWYCSGSVADSQPIEYRILLGTGGPASRIVGDLDEFGQPTNAKLEYQDWYKPWTAANDLSEKEDKTLLEYASQFWFGE